MKGDHIYTKCHTTTTTILCLSGLPDRSTIILDGSYILLCLDFGPLSPYVVFSWSFFIIFVILLAVSLRSVWSLQNISVLFTFVVLFVWIPLHSSSICSCVSVGSPHLHVRQVTLLCFPL